MLNQKTIELMKELIEDNDVSPALMEDKKNEFIVVIEEFFDKLHKNLDIDGEEVISKVVESFPKVEVDFTDNSGNNAKLKISNLMSKLDEMIKLASSCEEIISYFKDTKLNKLLKINVKESKFEIFLPKIKNFRYVSSCISDIYWDQEFIKKNRVGKARLNTDDIKELIIDNISCWNFIPTSEFFTTGVVKFHITVNNLISDSHFYIGAVNETKDLKANSGCLCCKNSGSFYYDRDGKFHIFNDFMTPRMTTTTKRPFTACVTLDIDNKKIIFQEEDYISEEFDLTGNSFRFIVSNCNSTKASITIN